MKKWIYPTPDGFPVHDFTSLMSDLATRSYAGAFCYQPRLGRIIMDLISEVLCDQGRGKPGWEVPPYDRHNRPPLSHSGQAGRRGGGCRLQG